MLALKIALDALFAALLIVCSVIDIKKHELANGWVIAALLLAIMNILLMPYSTSVWIYLCGAALSLPFLVLYARGKFGAADVKLMFAIGLFFGLFLMAAIDFLMLIISVVISAVQTSKAKKINLMEKKPVAMVPVISAPAIAVMAAAYFI